MKLHSFKLWTIWGLLWAAVATVWGTLTTLVGHAFKVRQQWLSLVPRAWGYLVMYGLRCPVRVRGRENLEADAAYVFASNHSSALDITAALVALPRNFRFLAKKELFEIPYFGPAMRSVGYIPVDRGKNRQAMKTFMEAAKQIKGGKSVLVFPEGTRTKDGNLLPFKSGAFLLAIRSGRPVVPTYIWGTRKAYKPGRINLTSTPIYVLMGKPIPTEGLKTEDREALAQLVRREVALLGRKAAWLAGQA